MNHLAPSQNETHAELTSMLGIHLSNLYSLMVRLQNFHWHVEGPHFYSAHTLFEAQYTELWQEIDKTAERIRALGGFPPATLKDFYELSGLGDRGQPFDLDGMFQDLITCSVVVREFCHEALKTAGVLADEVTADLLIKHMKMLEHAIWIYHSSSTEREKTTESMQEAKEHSEALLAVKRKSNMLTSPAFDTPEAQQSSPIPRV